MTRFLGVLLAGALLLAGCALVDDARRELAGEPGQRADPAPASPPAGPVPTASGSPPAGPVPTASGPVSPSTGGPDGDGGPGGCPPSGLLVRTGEVDAAMGLRVMSVFLVNCGTVPYTVNGYPELRLLDADRTPLPVTVGHGSAGVATLDNFDRPPVPVTAAPGERLAFGMVWRNTVTDTTIDPVNGVYLEVTPAVGQPPLVVRPEGRIDVGTTRRVGVTPWGPGTR
jgi:hypothetical protein